MQLRGFVRSETLVQLVCTQGSALIGVISGNWVVMIKYRISRWMRPLERCSISCCEEEETNADLRRKMWRLFAEHAEVTRMMGNRLITVDSGQAHRISQNHACAASLRHLIFLSISILPSSKMVLSSVLGFPRIGALLLILVRSESPLT